MLASLTGRLTLIYLGAAFTLFVILIIVGTIAEIEAFRLDVNSELAPGIKGALQDIKLQRSAGRSLKDAAALASGNLGRPTLRLIVRGNNGETVFDSYQPRNWRDRIIADSIPSLGIYANVEPVAGGDLELHANPQRLADAIGSNVLRMWPAMLVVIIITYGFARLIAVQSIRPLREVTQGLQSLAESDFTPKPIVASGASELILLSAAHNAAALNVQKVVSERDIAAGNIRNFISDASHELRTPLTIIMGYVEAVSEGLVAEPRDAQRVLKKTLSECRRMAATIEKLLWLARLDREDGHVGTVDLATLTTQITESMNQLVPGLLLEIPSNGTETLAVGDESELREAIVNVIDNAVKYAPGSPIDVRVSTTGDLVIVEIADAGPGMSPEDRERAFERFHRGSSHGDVNGSGLGLAIAKRAVQRANGRITLTSDLGRGTAVRLYLPSARTGGRLKDDPKGK